MTPHRGALWMVVTLVASCGGGNGGRAPDGGFDVTPDDVARSSLVLQLPAVVPPGVPFPVVVRTVDGAPVTAAVSLTGLGQPAAVALHRGRGSASASMRAAGEGRVIARRAEGDVTARTFTVATGTRRRVRGELGGGDLQWRGGDEIVLDGDVTVPAGATLVIEAGARVLGEARANLIVAGTVDARGTAEQPVLFSRAGDAAWGGLDFQSGSKGTLRNLLLTAGGGDDRRVFGHSGSQSVLFAGAGAEVLVEGGGAVDNPGKAYSSAAATLTLRDVVVSRCDQGGEHNDSTLTIERSHFVELPDGDGVPDGKEDDNDGMYLSSGLQGLDGTRQMIVRDTVIAMTEDDGIDHAGALLTVERVWIDRVAHEGIATSNGGRVRISDTVVRNAAQGIEVGWGWPDVVVEHSVVTANGVGLRWGDEYETKNEGKLVARYVASFGNRTANVKNLWQWAGVSVPEAMEIGCSLVATPEWDGRANNVAGEASADDDGCLPPSSRMLPGCPAGPVGPRCSK